MKPVVDFVHSIGEVVNKLTLPSRQKKQLESELSQMIYTLEERIASEQAVVLREEARGHWLQRSWRPLVMLTFAFIILIGIFTDLPLLADTSRFWDLLEIGLGGYLIGRSGEKIAGHIFHPKKN